VKDDASPSQAIGTQIGNRRSRAGSRSSVAREALNCCSTAPCHGRAAHCYTAAGEYQANGREMEPRLVLPGRR
jgi:hypothetical protein